VLIDDVIAFPSKCELKVNAAKTESLTIRGPGRWKPATDQTPNLPTNGKAIRKSQELIVLGIPIKEQLTVDLENRRETEDKMTKNLLLLRHQRANNILRSSQEWKTVVNSLVVSTTTYDWLLMLAVDRKAREWCNKKLDGTIAFALRWAHNTPLKFRRAVFNLELAEDILQKQLILGLTNEADPSTSGAFLTLHWVFGQGSLQEAIERTDRYSLGRLGIGQGDHGGAPSHEQGNYGLPHNMVSRGTGHGCTITRQPRSISNLSTRQGDWRGRCGS